MQNTDWFILAATFFTGIFAGAFIYVAGFQEIDISPTKPIAADVYTISVSYYGGCALASSCPSFRIVYTGEYTLLPGGDESPQNGSLSPAQQLRLAEYINQADLATMAEPFEWDFCESWVDGVDVHYQIEIGGKMYELDTCGTAIDVDNPLIEELDELYEVISS